MAITDAAALALMSSPTIQPSPTTDTIVPVNNVLRGPAGEAGPPGPAGAGVTDGIITLIDTVSGALFTLSVVDGTLTAIPV